MTKITAIIPTYNEESNIQKALDSVRFADEIIVIDSFSTDATIKIVQQSNAILLQRAFDNFSNQKNYAIHKATHNWIFLLDADEVVSDYLAEEIKVTVSSNSTNIGYHIYRSFYFKKTQLKFSGWQRDKVIRLFDKRFSLYKGMVHEKIVSNGSIGILQHKLKHYSYKSYQHYVSKLQMYAQLQAKELLLNGQFVTPYHLLLKPIVRFFIQFVIQLGFLDLHRGFVISWAHAFGVWRRYVEVLKLKHANSKTKVNSIAKFNPLQQDIDVSILIVNYKSWKHLTNCLNALTHLTEDKFSFEVVVVDNNSDDGHLEAFTKKYKQFKFKKNSGNNGFANGCNLAALNSKGRNLLFLNPDTIASEKSIKEMCELIDSNKNYGIVSCNQINNNGSFEDSDRIFPDLATLFGLTRAFYRKLFKKTRENDELVFADWVSGSVVFISRNWFEKIGGWNEDYWMYFEDVDLCKRVRDNNGQVVVLKNSKIIHNHGGASRINMSTAAITKSEVLISKHVYIRNHFTGFKRFVMLFLLVVSSFFSKLFLAILGIAMIFIPKMRLNIYLFYNLLTYYYVSSKYGTWLSKRSINFNHKSYG